jgi:hypothetical protein
MKAVGLVAAVGALCVALPVAAATSAPRSASAPATRLANSVVFEDSTGEDPAAPDIQSVDVANNDAGMLTFEVKIPNRPQLTSDMAIIVFADTDANPATGNADALGADYLLILDGTARTADLLRWDGNDYVQNGVPQSSLTFGYTNGVGSLRISAAELGATKRLNFGVRALSGFVIDPTTGDVDTSNLHSDLAPDPGHGFWSFTLKLAPLKLVVRTFSTKPARPTAGRTFTVQLVSARSDTGAVLQGGQVSCAATVGGRRLAARTHSVISGRATCTWTIPASARGQTLHGSVRIGFEGLSASRSFSARVA